MTARQVFPKHRESLGALRALASPDLGDSATARIRRFHSRRLYVRARRSSAFIASAVDFLLVFSCSLAFTWGYVSFDTGVDALFSPLSVFVFFLFVLPFAYGCFFVKGQALGGLLVGTRVVDIEDGHRIGWWFAGWAMLIRTTFCFVLLLAIVAFASGEGVASSEWSFGRMRISIDCKETAKLAEFLQANGRTWK